MTRVAWSPLRRGGRPAAWAPATKASPKFLERSIGMKSPVSGSRPSRPASSAEHTDSAQAMPIGGCGFCTGSGFTTIPLPVQNGPS